MGRLEQKALESKSRLADEACCRKYLQTLKPTADPLTLEAVTFSLAHPSSAVCEAAVEALARCQNTTAARAAARKLRSDDPRERGYALKALVFLALHSAPVALELLQDPDRDLRLYGVSILGAIKCNDALPMLIGALADKDINVAAAAAEALGAIGNPDAIPALAKITQEGPDWLCCAGIASLGSIGGSEAANAVCNTSLSRPGFVLASAVAAIRQIGWAERRASLTFLIRLLECADMALREGAVIAVAELSDMGSRLRADQVETLAAAALETTKSSSAEARAASVDCLCLLGRCHNKLLQKLSEDPEPTVRAAVLRAQVKFGILEPRDLVRVAAKRGEADDLRVLALHLLRESNTLASGGLEHAVASIITEDGSQLVRAAALAVLLTIRSPLAPPIAASLAAKERIFDDEGVIAELSHCSIGDLLPLISYLLAYGDSDTRRSAVESLLPIQLSQQLDASPAARDLVLAAARNPDWHVRAHAFHLLSACRAGWARHAITQGCQDSEPCVRVRAIEALDQIGLTPEEAPILLDQLQDGNGWIRAQCLDALADSNLIDETTILEALTSEFRPLRGAGLRAALHMVAQGGYSAEFAAAARKAASEARNADDEELARLAQKLARRLGTCQD